MRPFSFLGIFPFSAAGVGCSSPSVLFSSPFNSAMSLRRVIKVASKVSFCRCLLRVAVMLQYSSGTKARISASRSQTRRRATDCTRPALVPD